MTYSTVGYTLLEFRLICMHFAKDSSVEAESTEYCPQDVLKKTFMEDFLWATHARTLITADNIKW